MHFTPNVGGVETHLSDLVAALLNKGYQIIVLCYRPLSTNIEWKIYEGKRNLEILRLPWLVGFWYKLIAYPSLEFLYLFPGLFIFTPFILITKNPSIIHAHGLIAGVVGVFWGRIFKKRVIISTHNIYSFPDKGLYRNFAKIIFKSANKVLCLSRKSLNELKLLGVERVDLFTYWIDLGKFKKISQSKEKLGWENKFTVLFVGRLISEKGIDILLESSKNWDRNINLAFAGTGPLENKIKDYSLKFPRIKFLGKISQNDLPNLYSGADCVIVPSTSEEGFGRVIIESLSCATPVIASNRGAITEAIDDSVGLIIDINKDSIKQAVEYFYKNPTILKKLSSRARKFAERRYSQSNVKTIINAYSS